jgi:glycerol-3-phosphate dehydrogenase subunit B
MSENEYGVIVVGMGLSGLMAAMTAAELGKRVLIVGKGMGRLCLFSNSVDLLAPMKGKGVYEAITSWISDHPDHPYAKAGVERIDRALSSFSSLFPPPYAFSADSAGNWRVPTGAGTYRSTFLLPSTMTSGADIDKGGLIVGIEKCRDFSALQAAKGLQVRGVVISLSAIADQSLTPMALSRLMDKPSFRRLFAAEVKRRLGGESRVGFPAVLGLRDPARVKEELENSIGAEVFEIPILPPSIPGVRIFNRFKEWFDRRTDVTFLLGFEVEIGMVKDRKCTGVRVMNPPVSCTYTADSYIIATGRFLSGGLVADREALREPVFGLPVVQPPGRDGWFKPSFLRDSHPLNEVGIRVDGHFRPIDPEGNVILKNVRMAGSMLAQHNSMEEASREGISLSTGYAAATEAIQS